MSAVEREQTIKNNLLLISGDGAFDDSSNAQSQALEWLLNEDEAYVCPGDSNLSQRYSMAVFYFNTNGDGWLSCTRSEATPCKQRRFLSQYSECYWGGLDCDSTGSLSRINIDSNNVQGSIPKEIGSLSRLFELDIDSNRLSGEIPTSIGDLSLLVYLDLDDNNLQGQVPEEIYSLSLLRSIDLDTNLLTGTISSKIGELNSLLIVQYDYNMLTGQIPTEVASLSKLSYFTVVGNAFAGSVPDQFCDVSFQTFASCTICEINNCCTECA